MISNEKIHIAPLQIYPIIDMDTALIYNPDDTICAISTPAGTGGIAVARISGNNALSIVDKIWRGKSLMQASTHSAHLGTVIDADGNPLDQAVATVFRAPGSFTGDNVVEISVHGSQWIQQQLINSLVKNGARLALPGEFTQRAFAAGKLDLAQAEAVADMIASSSRAAHKLAFNQMRGGYSKQIIEMRNELVDLASLMELELDFSEEEVEFASRQRLLELSRQLSDQLHKTAASFASGQAIKNGIPIAIIGATNAGKSSLLNTLVGDERAIVSNIHGTTRDTIEDTATIGDYLVRFIDTAGLRNTDDPIEKIGIERSRSAADKALIVLYVLDSTAPLPESFDNDIANIDPERVIIVSNKTDITTDKIPDEKLSKYTCVNCSALTGQGIDQLTAQICRLIAKQTHTDNITVANARHARAMTAAAESLDALHHALSADIPTDLAAQDLRQAIFHLSAITGQITAPEILSTIFSRFCIGK